MKFTITVEMNDRWVPHFLGTLKRQQLLGSLGSSRDVTIHADGDGDYRPKFEWGENLPEPAKPSKESNGNTWFDAG